MIILPDNHVDLSSLSTAVRKPISSKPHYVTHPDIWETWWKDGVKANVHIGLFVSQPHSSSSQPSEIWTAVDTSQLMIHTQNILQQMLLMLDYVLQFRTHDNGRYDRLVFCSGLRTLTCIIIIRIELI